jgi:hypothetical protein
MDISSFCHLFSGELYSFYHRPFLISYNFTPPLFFLLLNFVERFDSRIFLVYRLAAIQIKNGRDLQNNILNVLERHTGSSSAYELIH